MCKLFTLFILVFTLIFNSFLILFIVNRFHSSRFLFLINPTKRCSNCCAIVVS